jgi:DUF1365 family protein
MLIVEKESNVNENSYRNENFKLRQGRRMYLKMVLSDVVQYLPSVAAIIFACFLVRVVYLFSKSFEHLKYSRLYYGRVTHTRLKGGAVHHLNYPIFFAYLDLKEIQSIGWSLWPIFKLNSPFSSFASFDDKQHLKDYQSQVGHHKYIFDQAQQVAQLQASDSSLTFDRIGLLTHLTYFGYCFNPISVYYLFKKQSSSRPTDKEEKEVLDTVIAEVSNTPWIEMHTYVLRKEIPGVQSVEKEAQIQGTSMFRAIWKKCFHVSPFMEMDYMYDFAFSSPALTSTTNIPLQVRSKMLKESTGDVWFTANFDISPLPFTPRNLLYVLIFYPMQTRLIQVFIHWEALKLFLKGVPTFEHPNGADVDFGCGITGQRLGAVLWFFIAPFYKVSSWVTGLMSRNGSSIGISTGQESKKVL